jgi:hypothetical protein
MERFISIITDSTKVAAKPAAIPLPIIAGFIVHPLDSDRVGQRDLLPRDERRSGAVGFSSKFAKHSRAAVAVAVTTVIIDDEPKGSTLLSFYGLDDQKLSLPANIIALPGQLRRRLG